MLITCPSCATRYNIPDSSIGERGRSVRCSSCAHRWHVEPEPPEEEARRLAESLPSVDDEFDIEFETDTGDEPDDTADETGSDERARGRESSDREVQDSAEPVPPPAPERARSSFLAVTGWLLLLGLVLAAGGLVVARDEVVEIVPESSPVYRALGLPVTESLGLEIRAIHTETLEQDGSPVVVVRGEVHNIAGREREVPLILVRLLDGAQDELEQELVMVDQPSLPVDGMTRFELKIVAPPETAESFSVAFDLDS